MSAERVRALLELMQAYGLSQLLVEEGDFRVSLVRAAPPPAPAPAAPAPAAAAAPAPAAPAPDGGDESGWVAVRSPIVGTFYRASSPDAEPFVSVGARVGRDTVVCIVDAMKIMNEIKADVSGTLMRALVENGEPVEYDQPLFLVRP